MLRYKGVLDIRDVRIIQAMEMQEVLEHIRAVGGDAKVKVTTPIKLIIISIL